MDDQSEREGPDQPAPDDAPAASPEATGAVAPHPDFDTSTADEAPVTETSSDDSRS